jgi:hypothetical protein
MDDEMKRGLVDEIQELIGLEKEEADRHFEAGRFDSRMMERIRQEKERKARFWPIIVGRFGPRTAVVLILLAVAGVILFREFSRPSPGPTARIITRLLSAAGGGRLDPDRTDRAPRLDGAEYTEVGWALKGVLYASLRQSLEDIGLTGALSTALGGTATPAAPGEEQSPSSFPRPESMKLRTGEEYRLFFSGFLKRLKEV